jgi:hypothetical protein
MTNKQLTAIRERCEADRLPPAPWHWHYYSQFNDGSGSLHAPCTPSIIANDIDEATGKFCANARQDIPLLLAEVERLRGLVEFAYCEGYEDSKDFEQHWSNSASRARLEGEG